MCIVKMIYVNNSYTKQNHVFVHINVCAWWIYIIFMFPCVVVDLNDIKSKNEEKQLIFESQEYSQEDIEQIKIHRKDMLRQIDDAEARVASVDQEIWAEEMKTSKMLETVCWNWFWCFDSIHEQGAQCPYCLPKWLMITLPVKDYLWEMECHIFLVNCFGVFFFQRKNMNTVIHNIYNYYNSNLNTIVRDFWYNYYESTPTVFMIFYVKKI